MLSPGWFANDVSWGSADCPSGSPCSRFSVTAMETATFLTVPGWNGSGPAHWQTIWEQRHPNFKRIEQDNWHRPSPGQWVQAIQAAVQQAHAPVFLVAHSLGCLAVAQWAAGGDIDRVGGALLVAPPWLSVSDSCPAELLEFLPMPTRRLPFPSILAASQNDPYLPIEIASRLAKAWGSEFADIGQQGHVNVASGHGEWPQGQRLLERVRERTLETAHVVVSHQGAVAKW
jgi:predicted alpha/beta hydrolase family esterase